MPQTNKFTSDPTTAQPRIPFGGPQHQRLHRVRGRRPARPAPALAVVPLAGDESGGATGKGNGRHREHAHSPASRDQRGQRSEPQRTTAGPSVRTALLARAARAAPRSHGAAPAIRHPLPRIGVAAPWGPTAVSVPPDTRARRTSGQGSRRASPCTRPTLSSGDEFPNATG